MKDGGGKFNGKKWGDKMSGKRKSHALEMNSYLDMHLPKQKNTPLRKRCHEASASARAKARETGRQLLAFKFIALCSIIGDYFKPGTSSTMALVPMEFFSEAAFFSSKQPK